MSASRNEEHWRYVGTLEQVDGRWSGSVRPKLFPAAHPLAGVTGATNAITFHTELLGDITVSGPGVYFNHARRSFIIDHEWKTGRTPKDYTLSLGFKVERGGASVSASLTQHPAHELKGSIVPPYKHEAERFFVNAANAWWQDGCHPKCRWRPQGSADYQGAIVMGLWQFPQEQKAWAMKTGFETERYLQHHCANPAGCR